MKEVTASTTQKEMAKITRKKLKKIKSPDIKLKKYSFYDPARRCYFYADKKSVLDNMIEQTDKDFKVRF